MPAAISTAARLETAENRIQRLEQALRTAVEDLEAVAKVYDRAEMAASAEALRRRAQQHRDVLTAA